MLLVLLTLLCAIYPLGLPASQRTGSAFNPATEIVTVRPEARAAMPRTERISPDPREPERAALQRVKALPGATFRVASRPFEPRVLRASCLQRSAATPFAPRAPPAFA